MRPVRLRRAVVVGGSQETLPHSISHPGLLVMALIGPILEMITRAGARQLERGGRGSNVGLRAGAGQGQIAGDSGTSLCGLVGGWEGGGRGTEMAGGGVHRRLWGRTGGQAGGVNSGWGLLSLRPQLPPGRCSGGH